MINCENLKTCFIEFSDRSKTLKDRSKGSSIYKIENLSGSIFIVIDFENCVYKGLGNETKCDYALKKNNEIYFIELKGSDVKKGIAQILSTIDDVRHCFLNYTLHGRIIVTKFPKPNIIKQTKEYKDLMKLTNLQLVIKQNIYLEKI